MRFFISLAMFSAAIAFSLRSSRFATATLSQTCKMSSAADTTKTAISSNDIMVFSKTYCPYCTRAKEALSKLNVKFEVYELDARKDGDDIQAALLEMTGQRTVPNVFVKGKHVGGCDNTLAAIKDGSFKKMMEA